MDNRRQRLYNNSAASPTASPFFIHPNTTLLLGFSWSVLVRNGCDDRTEPVHWNKRLAPLDFHAASGAGVDGGFLIRWRAFSRNLRFCFMGNAGLTKDMPANDSKYVSLAMKIVGKMDLRHRVCHVFEADRTTREFFQRTRGLSVSVG